LVRRGYPCRGSQCGCFPVRPGLRHAPCIAMTLVSKRVSCLTGGAAASCMACSSHCACNVHCWQSHEGVGPSRALASTGLGQACGSAYRRCLSASWKCALLKRGACKWSLVRAGQGLRRVGYVRAGGHQVWGCETFSHSMRCSPREPKPHATYAAQIHSAWTDSHRSRKRNERARGTTKPTPADLTPSPTKTLP